MRYVVLGAGAVGGTVGARLADSGKEVVLLARGAHADAMRRSGLRVATPERVITVHLPVVDDPADLRLHDGDVLLLATKTDASAGLLDRVTALDGALDRPVVCVQNGVANERIALRRFPHVYGVVVMLPAVLLEPGRIDAQGTPYSGLLDVGRIPNGVDGTARAIAADLSTAGFVSRPVPDIMRWKYAKLLRNLGNAIEALCGHDLDDDALPTIAELDRRLRAEAESVFDAAGIDWVRDDEWQERRGSQVEHAPVEGRARAGGSSWQSLARGARRIEADYLNGEIVLLARLAGVTAPLNDRLRRLANDIARSGRGAGTMPPAQVSEALEVPTGG